MNYLVEKYLIQDTKNYAFSDYCLSEAVDFNKYPAAVLTQKYLDMYDNTIRLAGFSKPKKSKSSASAYWDYTRDNITVDLNFWHCTGRYEAEGIPLFLNWMISANGDYVESKYGGSSFAVESLTKYKNLHNLPEEIYNFYPRKSKALLSAYNDAYLNNNYEKFLKLQYDAFLIFIKKALKK